MSLQKQIFQIILCGTIITALYVSWITVTKLIYENHNMSVSTYQISGDSDLSVENVEVNTNAQWITFWGRTIVLFFCFLLILNLTKLFYKAITADE